MTDVKLVILDVNGISACKVKKNTFTGTYQKVDLKVYNFVLNPAIRDFINELFDKKYEVAIWSSTTYRNASSVIEKVFTPEQKENLVFEWYRDKMKVRLEWHEVEPELDPEYGLNENIKSYDTVKNLEKVFKSPLINSEGIYNKTNTILIDDSVFKTRFNNSENLIIVPSYNLDEILNLKQKDDIVDILIEERNLIDKKTCDVILDLITERFEILNLK